MAIDKKAPKKKSTVDYSSPLYIGNEMKAFDLKDRAYYDKFTDEEKKKFSPFLMLKWGATVSGDHLLESYYLISVNENVNKNFFDLSKHPKLQWLVCTTASPGIGAQRHVWINAKKKESQGRNASLKKLLIAKIPGAKLSDIDNIIKMSSDEEIIKWLQQHGLSKAEEAMLNNK